MTNFFSLGISESMVNTLKTQGIATPTPIQEQAIPLLLDGKDVIAQSQTGTGKTFAFILPILEKIVASDTHIQALIVTPTRELALQITNEVKKLLEERQDIRVLAIYGGQDVASQLNKLKNGRHIVIGTPGRLLDHIRRGTVDFSKTKFLVLDEADQMLHIGFLPEVEQIISETSNYRQTMLFSATMPDEIKKLARRHMKNPQYIQVEKTQAPLKNIKQIAISTDDRAKQGDLLELLHLYRPFLGVIFCRTKRRVSKLYEAMRENGFNCDELHGDLTQAKREKVMKRFRNAEIQLLVATDVAARGLDIDGVTHVFNFDIPEDTESYIHRIGRTGRAGGEGHAITLYSPKDREALLSIEKDLNLTIPKKNIGNEKKNLGVETGEEDNQSLESQSPKRAKKGKNERAANRRSKEKEMRDSGPRRESRGGTPRNKPEGGFQPSGSRKESKDENPRKRSEGGFQGSGPRRESRDGAPRNKAEGGFRGSGPRKDSREGTPRNRTEGGFQGSGPRRESSDGAPRNRTAGGYQGSGPKKDNRNNHSSSQVGANQSERRGGTSKTGSDFRKGTSSTGRKPFGQQTRKPNKTSGPRSRNK